jgi:hypothetical protein
MQPWQIKALKLEMSVLNHLDEFTHEHALCFLIGVILLLLALLMWVLSGALWRKEGESMSHVRPVIFIHPPGPPSLPNTLDSFPPWRDHPDCNHDEH